MNQYSQEDKRRRQMKLSGKAAAASKEKRTILIIVSCILAIILIAGIIALVKHFKKPETPFVPSQSEPAVSEQQTEAPTQTQAPETTTSLSGDVTVKDY